MYEHKIPPIDLDCSVTITQYVMGGKYPGMALEQEEYNESFSAITSFYSCHHFALRLIIICCHTLIHIPPVGGINLVRT